MNTRNPQDLHFVALCLTHHLCRPDQLQALIEKQADEGRSLGDLLVEAGHLSREQHMAIIRGLASMATRVDELKDRIPLAAAIAKDAPADPPPAGPEAPPAPEPMELDEESDVEFGEMPVVETAAAGGHDAIDAPAAGRDDDSELDDDITQEEVIEQAERLVRQMGVPQRSMSKVLLPILVVLLLLSSSGLLFMVIYTMRKPAPAQQPTAAQVPAVQPATAPPATVPQPAAKNDEPAAIAAGTPAPAPAAETAEAVVTPEAPDSLAEQIAQPVATASSALPSAGAPTPTAPAGSAQPAPSPAAAPAALKPGSMSNLGAALQAVNQEKRTGKKP